jgi:putative transposase
MHVTSDVGKWLKEHGVGLLHEGVRVVAQALMETEVSSQIGAGALWAEVGSDSLPKRLPDQNLGHAGGGTIELKVPKVTTGTYSPSLLEPRRRAEKAPARAVICEAYVKGISTRKVDELVWAMDMDGLSRSEVSRICKALDEDVRRSWKGASPGPTLYVWLDGMFQETRLAETR